MWHNGLFPRVFARPTPWRLSTRPAFTRGIQPTLTSPWFPLSPHRSYTQPSPHSRPNSKSNSNSRRRFEDPRLKNNRAYLFYSIAGFITLIGATYASVPLYRMFCSVTGIGGTPNTDTIRRNPDQLKPRDDKRKLRITFSASTSDALNWKFIPQQREVHVLPGETALAFYTAKNLGAEDVIGVATYNVTPLKAGAYFNKLQCFCFEEQRLFPGEEVDMPVFFFIDPEFTDDPVMRDVETITLSYTFFKAKEL
ncbi:Cytochrome c oxidase assembly protein cox11, mitochondrial [Dispira simplex]|nr:Cytochrome c oxidase assembly protein cox11, mitochondrial [Dispira simplex]